MGGGTMGSDVGNPGPDAAAAHEFLCDLRTRISTQRLPYQYGVEARALESLWEVFAQARSAMKNHPGCERFARRTTEMLNVDLRPLTSKWHRAHEEGRLKSRDGANEFRADLEAVQVKLNAFADELHEMAYGTTRRDSETPPAIDRAQVEQLFAALPFGIAADRLIPRALATCINEVEATAIVARRKAHGIEDTRP